MSKNKPMEADSSEKTEKADTSSDSPVVSTNKEETPTTTTTEKDAKKAKGNEPPVEDVVVLDKENADVNVSLTTGDKPKKELTNPIFEELKSAFPNIEDKYIKAVLVASQGVINPAFNALLYLSDPSFENEVQLPPQPIRPVRSPTQLQQTQLQQDELLARHLDEQYNQKRESSAHRRHREYARRQQASFPEESDDEDFIDTINRGLQETSKKVGIWWDGIKKNFAEDKERFGDPVHTQPSQNFRQRRFNSFGAHDDEVLTSQTRGNVANARNRRYVHPEEHEDDETDIPPKLPARKATETNDRPADESTETAQPKLWQPRPSQPSRTSPKVSAISASHTPPIAHGPIKLDPDQDEFLINSDDEL